MTDQVASPLRQPLFRAFWMASLGSNLGSLIQAVGASWTMTALGASAHVIALVQTCASLPIMLLALLAGALADGFDRRKIMLLAQGSMLVASLVLAAVTYLGSVAPWSLLALTFLIGCGAAVNGPAWHASAGDIVPRAALPRAVALNSMGFNVARSLGPAIGGAIVAAAGVTAAFLANAISYLGLIAVLLRWKPNRLPSDLPREPLLFSMLTGIRFVRHSPDLLSVLFRTVLFGLGASALPALMPLIARDLLHGGPLTYGLLLGGFGGGAVIGALASTYARERLSTEQVVSLASALMACSTITLAIIAHPVLAVAVVIPAGVGWVMALTTFNVTMQMNSPRWVVARSIALYQTAAFGGLAGGSWLFGWLTDLTGIPIGLAAAAATMIVSAFAGLILRLPAVSGYDLIPRSECARVLSV